MYKIIRFFLFLLPAEFSHQLSLRALKFFYALGLIRARQRNNERTVILCGLSFSGRLGLAAGLDKNGDYIDALAALGFDFIEVGTVTPKPQYGSAKPRLFRLTRNQAIINRMGFNNKGIDYLVEQVKKTRYRGVLGINIGKNKDTPNERALDDYVLCMNKAYPHASYITINLSSPNTPGLRDLQFGAALDSLLRALKDNQMQLARRYAKYVPLMVKISPDLDDQHLRDIAQILLVNKMDAVIASNTTLDKSAVAASAHGAEQGGLSGLPLRDKSTHLVKKLNQYLEQRIPIIGVGGIDSVDAAHDKLAGGASLVQIYTAFIYQGPGLIKRIARAINA